MVGLLNVHDNRTKIALVTAKKTMNHDLLTMNRSSGAKILKYLAESK